MHYLREKKGGQRPFGPPPPPFLGFSENDGFRSVFEKIIKKSDIIKIARKLCVCSVAWLLIIGKRKYLLDQSFVTDTFPEGLMGQSAKIWKETTPWLLPVFVYISRFRSSLYYVSKPRVWWPIIY